jgi:hypothetical protein
MFVSNILISDDKHYYFGCIFKDLTLEYGCVLRSLEVN